MRETEQVLLMFALPIMPDGESSYNINYVYDQWCYVGFRKYEYYGENWPKSVQCSH